MISVSIVSHGQSVMVNQLVRDLISLNEKNIELIITENIPDDHIDFTGAKFKVVVIKNNIPKGFGDNHNAAFSVASGKYFLVVNPDIRLQGPVISQLVYTLNDPSVGVVSPLVLNRSGDLEDSFRRFPTLGRIFSRAILGIRKPDYSVESHTFRVDWAAGMFLAFRAESYRSVNGFDARRFFMYLEDADICRRMTRKGLKVLVDPSISVIHNAQRASRRNLKHMRWHVISMFRYLTRI